MLKKEDLEQFINKEIKIFLKSSRIYTGKIITIEGDTIKFIDKFNKLVLIDLNNISEIVERGDEQ